MAADDAYADLVRKCVMMRRMHDSVRLRYHKLMRAATAEEAALLHSHNDSIRFLSWLFAVMKVRIMTHQSVNTYDALHLHVRAVHMLVSSIAMHLLVPSDGLRGCLTKVTCRLGINTVLVSLRLWILYSVLVMMPNDEC